VRKSILGKLTTLYQFVNVISAISAWDGVVYRLNLL
jgi:hypothetical protein